MASKLVERTDEPPAPGMRRVELRVWDTESPEFQAMLERSAAILRTRAIAAEEQDVTDWCEATAAEVWAGIDEDEERARRTKG